MNYKTIYSKKEASEVYVKSKFIATISPVESEEEAIFFINEMKKKYYDARHNVFAYRIFADICLERQSDDGEPNQTAGLPVLNVLRTQELFNVCINVTRYFGGTLLGTGGLVRAYTNSSKAAVSECEIITKSVYNKFLVVIDYTLSGKILYEINKNEWILLNSSYEENVKLTLLTDNSNYFIKTIIELTDGKANIFDEGSVRGFLRKGHFEVC